MADTDTTTKKTWQSKRILCVECRKAYASKNTVLCDVCIKQKEHIPRGICKLCGAATGPRSTLCQPCVKEQNRQRALVHHNRKRLEREEKEILEKIAALPKRPPPTITYAIPLSERPCKHCGGYRDYDADLEKMKCLNCGR